MKSIGRQGYTHTYQYLINIFRIFSGVTASMARRLRTRSAVPHCALGTAPRRVHMGHGVADRTRDARRRASRPPPRALPRARTPHTVYIHTGYSLSYGSSRTLAAYTDATLSRQSTTLGRGHARSTRNLYTDTRQAAQLAPRRQTVYSHQLVHVSAKRASSTLDFISIVLTPPAVLRSRKARTAQSPGLVCACARH